MHSRNYSPGDQYHSKIGPGTSTVNHSGQDRRVKDPLDKGESRNTPNSSDLRYHPGKKVWVAKCDYYNPNNPNYFKKI